MSTLAKDEMLDRLAESANVAQFVSFASGAEPAQRYCRLLGLPRGFRFAAVGDAVRALFARSPEGKLNIRSFVPGEAEGGDFHYGLPSVEAVVSTLAQVAASGLCSIVNETIDVHDGGVSGVVAGGVAEFAPGYTPRVVEQREVTRAELPSELAQAVLQRIYGFSVPITFGPALRVEFSLHPLRRGHRQEHIVLWQQDAAEAGQREARIHWPNELSRSVGDKAYGLVVADAIGLPVPATTVVPRRLAPFRFGQPTGTGESWIRTCPVVQDPGRYTTQHGWTDPFALLQAEDPTGEALAAVLAQEGVEPIYSGAMLTQQSGELLVEGIAGSGEAFMLGERAPEVLPDAVLSAVRELWTHARARLGPVRAEWVFDGVRAWLVQLHPGASPSAGRTIVPGTAKHWHALGINEGIGALRTMIAKVQGTADGIVLLGNPGINSHLADLLRRAGIPSRIQPPAAEKPQK
jgi:hypothetical protein